MHGISCLTHFNWNPKVLLPTRENKWLMYALGSSSIYPNFEKHRARVTDRTDPQYVTLPFF